MYAPQEDRVWIAGGRGLPGDRAVGTAARRVKGFWIDPFPVTNEDFAAFVDATDWLTVAERGTTFKSSDGERQPGSMVWRSDNGRPSGAWEWIAGANWRHPQGPGTDLEGLWDHPVVHVAWADALGYANWVGAELPTEAEWELAAGDVAMEADAIRLARDFSSTVTPQTQWAHTSPVGSFAPNQHGLFDMVGNVWEWTADEWPAAPVRRASPCLPPVEAGDMAFRVLKGGAFNCHAHLCDHLQVGARLAQAVACTTGSTGFRCVVRPRQGAGSGP